MKTVFLVLMVVAGLAGCNENGTTVSVKTDSLGRELDTLGEKIEEETENAGAVIGEKAEKAGDYIETKAERAGDTIKAKYKALRDGTNRRIDSVKADLRDTTE